MLHTLSLGAALTVLWLLLSGIFTPILLGLGLASIVVTLWLAHRMDVIDQEGHPIHLAPHALLFYWPWLAWQIAKSNWDMAKVILSPKMPIHPHVFVTKATQRTETGRTTYANSITLTPGTVTLSTSPDGDFEIHVITDAARRDVETLEMDRHCTALEGKPKPHGETA